MRVNGKVRWLSDPHDQWTWEILEVGEPDDDNDEVFQFFSTVDELLDAVARTPPGQQWIILDLDDWEFNER